MSQAKQQERTPWRYLTVANAVARLRKKRTNDKVAGDLRESSGSREQIPEHKGEETARLDVSFKELQGPGF